MNEIVARPELVELRTTDSQLEVEHDEFHGLWRHSLSAKAMFVCLLWLWHAGITFASKPGPGL